MAQSKRSSKVQVPCWRNFQMWIVDRLGIVFLLPHVKTSYVHVGRSQLTVVVVYIKWLWQRWPSVPLAIDLPKSWTPPHQIELISVYFVDQRCEWSPLDDDKGARWRNCATSANHMPSLFGRLFRIFFVSLIDTDDDYDDDYMYIWRDRQNEYNYTL